MSFDFSTPLLAWYAEHKRQLPWRESGTPYGVWLSEVMLQQTQVVTVIPYYERFLKAFPSPTALADAHEDLVLKMWEGLGYYNRCHNLLKAMRQVRDDHGGRIPDTPEAFSKLPGVGPYTCAAVQSIAFGHKIAAVDGNVIRVVSRLIALEDEVSTARAKKAIQSIVDGAIPKERPGDFNQAMMELGATICTPKKPACERCPIAEFCQAAKEKSQDSFPVKVKRKPVPTHEVALAAVVSGSGKLLVQKRPATGHLAGMWEFPGGKTKKGESHAETLIRRTKEETGFDIKAGKPIGTTTHAYSHFKVRLHLYLCALASGETPEAGRGLKGQPLAWIDIEALDDLAFPAANRKLFPLLKELLF